MSQPRPSLAELHDHYVEAVNLAVAEDDTARAHRLAEEFDALSRELTRDRVVTAA